MSDFTREFRLGWRELLGGTIGLACGTAFYVNLSSFFFRALEQEFGWSKTAASLALVTLAVTAGLLPVAGLLVDRFGVRVVALTSALCMGASLLWLSTMNGNIWFFYAGQLCANALGCATGPVSYTRVVAARFVKARGTALATALIGIALAGAIFPQVISRIIMNTGWRSAYYTCAAIMLVGGLIAFLLIRPQPPTVKIEMIEHTGDSVRHAFGTSSFWILALATLLITAATLGFVTQFVSVIVEKGFALSSAPTMLSVLAISVAASRIIVGAALDFFVPQRVVLGAMLLAAVGLGLFIYADGNLPLAIVGVFLLGFAVGAEMDLMSFFCARCFGLRHFSAIYGVISLFFYGGIAIGGVTYGLVHDKTGSYGPALVASALALVAAGVLMLGAHRVFISERVS